MKIFNKFMCAFFLFLLTIGCATIDDKRDVFYNKGQHYFQQRNYVLAKREFQNAVKIDPDFASGYCSIGECELRLGRINEAATFFHKAIYLDPEICDAHLALAEIMLANNNLSGAKDRVSKVMNMKSHNSRAEVLSSILYLYEGDIDTAENILNNFFQSSDNNKFEALRLLSGLIQNKSDLFEIVNSLSADLDSDEKINLLILALVGLYIWENDVTAVGAVYNHMMQNKYSEEIYADFYGKFFLLVNQPEKAAEIYNMLIKKYPDNIDYHIQLAKIFQAQEKLDKAIEILQEIDSEPTDEKNLQILISEIYVQRSNNKVNGYLTYNQSALSLTSLFRTLPIVLISFLFAVLLFRNKQAYISQKDSK